MIRATTQLVAALGLGLFASIVHAQATPAGLWKNIDDMTKQEKSLIRITEAGGMYTAKIEKLLDPAAKLDEVCDKCSDERKGKPILGLTIMKGLKQSDSNKGVWEGPEILDPGSGKTYKVLMTPVDDGKKMDVRGYIGAPVLGRTQTWIRVE